jgi:putative ABC transport system substrate-binding protein
MPLAKNEETPMRYSTVGLLVLLTLGMLATPRMSAAPQLAQQPRIGVLVTSSPAMMSPSLEAFRRGLHEHGWLEGQNITVEYRSAEGQVERLADLAAEFVRLKVDLIVTSGTQAIQAAKHATTTIPIVMAASSDAVGTGLVTSLSLPGGNITGLSSLNPDLSGKRLELLKEAVSGLSRVAILWRGDGGHLAAMLAMQETEAAGRVLGLQLQSLEVRSPNDFEQVFVAATSEGAQALIILASAFFAAERKRIVDLVTKYRLPSMFSVREDVEAGGLMSYGSSVRDSWRHAATYVDKILNGAKPADLPVEQPTKFELVINLKTAQALGLTIPPIVLFQADEVLR